MSGLSRMRWSFVLGFALHVGCGPTVQDPRPEADASLATARVDLEGLVRRGSYQCLVRAYEIGQRIHRREPERTDLRDSLARTALLLALRERQLAILGDRYLVAAKELLASCGECPLLDVLAEIAEATPLWSAGVISDDGARTMAERYRRARDRIPRWEATLGESLPQEPSAAVFYLALLQAYPRMLAGPETPTSVSDTPSPSALILFSAALAQPGEAALAEKALELEPSFVEAQLVIGKEAMNERAPAVAEAHYREAFVAFPDSVTSALGFADALFSVLALRQSLDLYDHVITLAPEHREAHLRKGIVLSQLGRNDEAIVTLTRLLDLGYWFLGETHYWLAWNNRQMKEHAEAVLHIEESKGSLPDDPRVHALAGLLALDEEKIALAERSFLEVLELAERSPGRYDGDDSLCESLASLGQIDFLRKDWEPGTRHFEQASACNAAAQGIVDAQIETIRGWGLPEPREAVLVRQKARLREEAVFREAACLYNAAAAAQNSGNREEAAKLAGQAGTHPAFKERAAALIEERP